MDELGKVRLGVAFSGGGFRATLFHLGVVRLLYENGYLGGNAEPGRKGSVQRVGAVSGGSVLAAHLALNWDRYTGERNKFDEAAKEVIDFVQKDIRGRIVRRWTLAWIWLIPRLIARQKHWTLTNLLQLYYDEFFKHANLKKLRRPAPEVFFNCTSLTSGSACYFGPTGFTRFKSDGEEVSVSSNEVRISFAVAASSAFPPLFPPIEISHRTLSCAIGEFDHPHYLSDGGVYDNLGINPWIWRPDDGGTEVFDTLMVSDAEGLFDSEFDKNYTWLVSRNVRASNLLMTRVSELQFDALGEASLIRIGIKNVLDEEISDDKYADHVISVEKQRALSKIRTDLDAFSPYEVTALIAHGFSIARSSLIRQGLLAQDTPKYTWDPMGKLDELTKDTDALTRNLREGSKRRWRIIAVSDPLTLLMVVGTLVLFGIGIFNSVRTYQAYVQDLKAKTANLVAMQVDAKTTELNATIDELRRELAAIQNSAKSPEFTTTSFQVCNGEHQANCPPGTAWLPCGASVKSWVDSQCSSASITRISTRGGNKCGYSIDQVLCTKQIN